MVAFVILVLTSLKESNKVLEMSKERLKMAAIKYKGKIYTGWRHCFIIGQICEVEQIDKVRGEKQGFITDTGRFVDRQEGLKIAFATGQIIKKQYNKHKLFSEEVWDIHGNPTNGIKI
jgi:hypothetical protein